MSDDYLWDGSGEPDPEVERLERLLERFKHERPVPELALTVRAGPGRLRRFVPWLAAAAAALIVAAGGLLLLRRETPTWEVARLDGNPRVGSSRIAASGRLAVGQWLETDASSRARISVGEIGEVEVEPNTRIGLLKARMTEHRLSLARGTMSARIWAPPKLFFVDTPSAVAVDLGCAYTLNVDDGGAGILKVTFGWVAVLSGMSILLCCERNILAHRAPRQRSRSVKRSSSNGAVRGPAAPPGGECVTRPGVGPGTPYFPDASGEFRASLVKLDFENGGNAALERVLSEAREKDSLTLWHLFPRVSGAGRGAVYDRLASLVPPPEGVSRAGVLRLEQPMLDLWRDRLPW